MMSFSLVFLSTVATAQVTVIGRGIDSCASFLGEANKSQLGAIGMVVSPAGETYYSLHYAYVEWANGYLSGLIVKGERFFLSDAAGIDGWLRQWCAAHPTATFVRALNTYADEHKGR
jgi:hypothetical protein